MNRRMNFDASRDFEVMDFLEDIIFRSRSASGQSTFTDYYVASAHPQAGVTTDSPLAGDLVQDELVEWTLWKVNLPPNVEPKVGDVVRQTTDQGVAIDWLVTKVNSRVFDTDFTLSTTRQAVGNT